MTIRRDERTGKIIPKPRPRRRKRQAADDPSDGTLINPNERPIKPVSNRALSGARRLCSALRTDGEPCGNYAVRGTSVCRFHGGNAPQVKARAKQRLEEAADRMARMLLGIAETVDTPHAVRLAAIKDALDRAGLSPRQTVDLEVGLKPFEQTLDVATTIQRLMPEPEPERTEPHEVIEFAERTKPAETRPALTAVDTSPPPPRMYTQAELQEGPYPGDRPLSRRERHTRTVMKP